MFQQSKDLESIDGIMQSRTFPFIILPNSNKIFEIFEGI